MSARFCGFAAHCVVLPTKLPCYAGYMRTKRSPCEMGDSLSLVIFLAGPTFFHTLALPAASTKSRRYTQRMRKRCWFGSTFYSYKRSLINPFTAKCGQRQVSTKFPNFIFENCEKKIAAGESTGRELSFKWSHHRTSSTKSKVRVTLQNSIKHSGNERVKVDSGGKVTFLLGTSFFHINRTLNSLF